MDEGDFEADRQRLINCYLAEALPEDEESNKDSGEAFRTLILENERLRHCVTEPGEDRDRVDAQTIAALQNSYKLGPENSVVEAAFRRLATDPEAAAGYVEAHDKARRSKQSQIAQKERPGAWDSITRKIEKIVSEETSKLPAKKVGRILEADADIELIGDEYRHKDGSTLKVANLPSRLRDARSRKRKKI
jgi:hypothetical protein